MLLEGTVLSFKDPETEKTLEGTVKSCNRRGTVCTLELPDKKTKAINLNKTAHTVASEPTATDEDYEDIEVQLEEHPANGHAEAESDPHSSGEEYSEEEEEVALQALDAFDVTLGKAIDSLTGVLELSTTDSQQDPESLAKLSKETLQALYALAKESPLEIATSAGLPQLYTDGFDSEQIWGQLDAGSKPSLKQARKRIRQLESCMALFDQETEDAIDELLQSYSQGNGVDEMSDEEELESQNDVDSDDIAEAETRKSRKRDGQNKRQRVAVDEKRRSRAKLPTEDNFFQLDDMERFVQDAEESAAKGVEGDKATSRHEDLADSDDEDPADSDVEGLDLDAIHGLGGIDDSDDESASDEEALLEKSLDTAYRQTGKGKSKKGQRAEDEGSDDEEDANAIYYADFFGPGPASKHQPRDEEHLGEAALDASVGKRKGEKAPEMDDLSDFELDDEKDSEEGEDELGNESDEEDADLEDGALPGEEDDDSDGQERLLSTLRNLIDQKKAHEASNERVMTAHELRQAKTAERARRLEEENMGEKDWHMRGEVRAEKRPLNSALEVDMDFERALKPPPLPTEEFTSSLEDLIKLRIAESQYDDPIRRAPPAADLQKELAEMDDKKASKGLGEEYADDFVRAKTGNTVEDKDDATRRECRLLLKGLFAKLDALSHFHFAPKPIIKEMSVQKEVPALAMEEVAPQVVSEAARQLPEETYRIDTKAMRKEQRETGDKNRQTARSSMKRALKKRKANEAEDRVQRGESADGQSNIIGRKSAKHDDEVLAAAKREKKKQKRDRSRPDDGPKVRYNKSAAVFGKIQDARDGLNAKGQEKTANAKALKL